MAAPNDDGADDAELRQALDETWDALERIAAAIDEVSPRGALPTHPPCPTA